MRTLDLTGAALDYAVAVAEQPFWFEGWLRVLPKVKHLPPDYKPSADWTITGRILTENYMIVRPTDEQDGRWVAFIADNCPDGYLQSIGDTPTEAIARCFVLSKVGMMLPVPPELLQAG